MTIDRAEKERFIAMYEGGVPIESIADAFGISTEYVYRRASLWHAHRPDPNDNQVLPGDRQLVHDWLLDQGILCEERPMPIVQREGTTP